MNRRFQEVNSFSKSNAPSVFQVMDGTNLYIFDKKQNEKFDEFKVKRLLYLKNGKDMVKTNLDYNKNYLGCKY